MRYVPITTITMCTVYCSILCGERAISRTAGRYDKPRLEGRRVGEVPYQRAMTSIVSSCPAFCSAGASGALRLVAWIFSTCKIPSTQSGCKWVANRELFKLPTSVLHVSCINITHVL